MYAEIDKYGNEILESTKDESINTLDVNMACLARVRNEFHRGKIVDITFDEKCDFTVYLVDTGEIAIVESTDVFNIPDKFVEMCAYQV